MIKFTSTGFVLGNLWEGGRGFYPAAKLEANTRAELITKAESDLKSGALDSGMGFDGLRGTLLNIKKTETKTIDGKDFQNEEFEEVKIGELDEDEEERARELNLF